MSVSSDTSALPNRVSVSWGTQLIEVFHLAPGSRWRSHAFAVEASNAGTRVLQDGAVLLAAGPGECASKTIGTLSVSLSRSIDVERVPFEPLRDLRALKIVSVTALCSLAVLISMAVTPTEVAEDLESMGHGTRITTFIAPKERTTPLAVKAFEPRAAEPRTALFANAQPRTSRGDRAHALVASLFGGGALDRVLSGAHNVGIEEGLRALGKGSGAVAVEGVVGLGTRGGGPGVPGGGLSIGSIGQGGPARPLQLGFGRADKKQHLPAESHTINTIISDGLPRDAVMAVIRRHQSEIKFCFERELQRDPNLAGKVAVSWTIVGDGSVEVAQLAESGLNNAGVEACMLERIRRWKFPEPRAGGVVAVTFPWVFRAAGSDEAE